MEDDRVAAKVALAIAKPPLAVCYAVGPCRFMEAAYLWRSLREECQACIA
jgi:hypothetical protein